MRVLFFLFFLSVCATVNAEVAYVSNFGSDSVSVIDLATGTVTNTIGVGTNPDQVAFSPDGSIAYVVNFGGDNVSVIDVATETVTNTIGVGTSPTGVAL